MTVKKAFRVLVIDDEPEARRLLKSLLEDIKNVEVVAEACYAEQAIYQIFECYPDLVFTDIDMPGKSGMDVIHLIRARNMDVPVVVVSAYKEFSIQSIKHEVYDFLLKPVDRKELRQVVDKYRRKKDRDLPGRLMEILDNIKEDSKIRINSRYSYILVDPSDIVFCQTEDGYTVIYLSNGKEEVASASLSQIEGMVQSWNFYKLGRSVLINLDYVRSVDKAKDKCILKSNTAIWELSASHKGINELLSNFYDYA